MASAKQQENMLLTEHFTWSPISLIDDIINAANEVLYKCTDTFESGLLAADPSILGFAEIPKRDNEDDEAYVDRIEQAKRLEIEEGTLKLETLMENALDRNLDRMEIWTLRNVLCLPREVEGWVKLGHYEALTLPSSQPSTTPEALHALRRKLHETQKLNAALTAEKARNEAQITKLRALLQPQTSNSALAQTRISIDGSTRTEGADTEENAQHPSPFSFLTHTPSANALGIQKLPLDTPSTSTSTTTVSQNTPLTTHTTFTTSQLPHLHSLLTSLRPHLASSALPGKGSGAGSKEERKVYIESQSRRVLERRGVDTKDGVEGVGSGEGFVRARGEEVGALEGWVEGLGRRRDGERDRRGDEDREGEGEEMDVDVE
ncbi:Mis12 domain-containing protein [Dendryphion nanum]|uniref:Mis12 domain-containing protein n=1 Tax=Dendryphion nanum TaxID=256645 RepID=A0A9P9E077_9PLEO|nr:Mis12 domain-containing protein [Dendryphion nanum]